MLAERERTMDDSREFLLKCLRRDGKYMAIRSGIFFGDTIGIQQLSNSLESHLDSGMSVDEFDDVSSNEEYEHLHIRVRTTYNPARRG